MTLLIDQDIISPYIISSVSSRQVRRIEANVNLGVISRSTTKLSKLTSKELEKDVFFCLVTSVGQRKNSEFPLRIKPQIFRFCAPPLSHTDSMVSQVYYKVHVTRVLHTAGISNVDSIVFVDRNKRDGKQ